MSNVFPCQLADSPCVAPLLTLFALTRASFPTPCPPYPAPRTLVCCGGQRNPPLLVRGEDPAPTLADVGVSTEDDPDLEGTPDYSCGDGVSSAGGAPSVGVATPVYGGRATPGAVDNAVRRLTDQRASSLSLSPSEI